MIDVFVSFWVENSVRSNCVIQNASLGDLFRLEAFVFLEVLSVVVTEMVVGDD